MPKLHYSSVDVTTLRPFEGNARRGDVDAIAESLQVNGQYKPLVVNRGTKTGRENEVLAGNHTLQAAIQIGLEEVDVVYVDVDQEAAVRIVLADNRTNDVATYDDGELLKLIKTLDSDLAGTGFTETDVLDLMESLDTGGYGAPGSADYVEAGEDAYDQQYGCIVVADDEAEQQAIYEDLKAQGYRVKVVTV
jgi:hypothetical protein